MTIKTINQSVILICTPLICHAMAYELCVWIIQIKNGYNERAVIVIYCCMGGVQRISEGICLIAVEQTITLAMEGEGVGED